MRRLLERRVHGDGRDQARAACSGSDTGMRRTPVVPRGLHREQAALGAAGRDSADDSPSIAVQHAIAREADQFALHHGDRGERGRVEAVHRLHHPDGRCRQLVELGEAGVVDVAEHVAAVGGASASRSFAESGEDLGGLFEKSGHAATSGASMSTLRSGYRANDQRLSAMITAGTMLKLSTMPATADPADWVTDPATDSRRSR